MHVPVDFLVHIQILFCGFLGSPLHQVDHVMVAQVLNSKRWEVALLTDIIHDLAYPLVIGTFRLGARRLVHLKLEVVDPKVPTIEIPVGVLLVNFSGLLHAALGLPQQPRPFSGKRAFGVDVALVVLNLRSVNGNCSIESTLPAFKVGPCNNGLNATRNYKQVNTFLANLE
jgi:hypothetical protein